MKLCPYCAEQIQDAAIKCKHCGEFLDGRLRPPALPNSIKWYFRTPFIILAVCCVGPFALPLIWWHPKCSPVWKIWITLVILALTYFFYEITVESVRTLNEYYKLLE